MLRNRPRIKPFTNKRMEGGAFVNSWSIRGWLLGAQVNAVRERWLSRRLVSIRTSSYLTSAAVSKPQSASEEELRPFVGRTLMPRILDKAFKGEL